MSDHRQAQIEMRRKLYKPGARVSLSGWAPSEIVNDYGVVPTHTEGVVSSVDGIGTVHVRWANGAALGVTLEDDLIRLG